METQTPAKRTERPAITTPADLAGQQTTRVWHDALPNAAGLFDPPLMKGPAYRAAAAGDLPVIKVGGRYYCVVADLFAMLGIEAPA
ncbi:hypothetical protein [Marmoricola sp. RAF53]|uniref:hypothetical protein n=1 Tax=Marmoricola sp. RAF53 TaxID=3233059 RepID=UPI003F97AF70